MASRKENIKSLFSNTRTRVIIIFTVMVLMVAVIIGYVKIKSIMTGPPAAAELVSAPGIQSIPGSAQQTAQYANLQQQQNVNQALVAEKTNKSAIPTIINVQAVKAGVDVVGPKTGVGFQTLAREDQDGAQKSFWLQTVKDGNCSKSVVDKVINQGAQLSDIKEACTCLQFKNLGYALNELQQVCSCKDLKGLGYTIQQFKDLGFSAGRLKDCGFTACEERGAGFSAQEMKDGGFSDGELKGSGFSDNEIAKASALPEGISASDVRRAGCDEAALRKLREAGVSASAIKRMNGCSARQLKNAGFDAKSLLDAGYTPAELLAAGFTSKELELAGVSAAVAGNKLAGDCSVESLKKARSAGESALSIKQRLGCSAKAMKDAGYSAKDLKNAGFTAAELKNAGFNLKELKDAGFSPKELKDAGFSAKELKDAGFSAKDLKDAGFSAKDLKDAGFSAKDLKDAGFSAKDLKDAGFSAKDLKDAGFSAKDLKDAGFSAAELKAAGFSAAQLKAAGFSAQELKDAGFSAAELLKAGYSPKELKDAGFSAEDLAKAGLNAQDLRNAGFLESEIAGLTDPSLGRQSSSVNGIPNRSAQAMQSESNDEKLQAILDRQNQQMAEQKYQQKIQQRTSEMLSAASQSIQGWKTVNTQVYTAGNEDENKAGSEKGTTNTTTVNSSQQINVTDGPRSRRKSAIKTGDILFAVMDTSVNSDEPGPILATIVSGKLKGSKLIGSFNLPSNADKMVINFNTLSVPGLDDTISIQAYAIDPNTARTALSSRTNHHYMMRYGSLFASSFLQGFGNAFQSANTTVTIGGTGGGNDITVSNGVGRSTLQNAVIGLATLGKAWGQQAQQIFNTPTTVQVHSGTALGILFTQDVKV